MTDMGENEEAKIPVIPGEDTGFFRVRSRGRASWERCRADKEITATEDGCYACTSA